MLLRGTSNTENTGQGMNLSGVILRIPRGGS